MVDSRLFPAEVCALCRLKESLSLILGGMMSSECDLLMKPMFLREADSRSNNASPLQ